MKKTFNGVQFSECTFIPEGDTNRINGLFVHDMDDVNGDGDGVIASEFLPETGEEADDLLQNEYLQTLGSVLDTVEK